MEKEESGGDNIHTLKSLKEKKSCNQHNYNSANAILLYALTFCVYTAAYINRFFFYRLYTVV